MNERINRDEIYIGDVVKVSKYQTNIKYYRKIMYTINANKIVWDLLYDSPNYPILENTYPAIDIIGVVNSHNIGRYLDILGYNSYLSLDECKEARKALFGAKQLIHNNFIKYQLEEDNRGEFESLMLSSRDRYFKEFLLTRIGDMAKIYNDKLEKSDLYQIHSLLYLYKLACIYYPENRYNRFLPSKEEASVRILKR